MPEHNKVIWSAGMYLLPQHFQQQERYVENMIQGRCQQMQPYGWGVYTLTLDHNLLSIGKVAISECRGIFPDGTPFHLPADDELPPPLDIPADTRNAYIYLTLPLRRPQSAASDSNAAPDGLARYRMMEKEVRDSLSGEQDRCHLQVGGLKTELLLESRDLSAYTCIAVARIIDLDADLQIRLDDQYIPPSLNCLAIPMLRGYLRELHGLFNTRGEALSGRVLQADHGGVAEIADFMMLQMVNRYQPLLEHLLNVVGLHPDQFYRHAVQMAGELSTFFSAGKRPISLPEYQHDDLQATFRPLMIELRKLLGKVFDPNAVQIPLSQPKFGVYAAKVPEKQLLEDAIFVLAVNAQVSSDNLRERFPPQITIGPVEKIQKYVASLTTGIGIHPLSVVPRQIPYHAGYTYFELDKHCEQWAELKSSAGFAMYIGGKFPGLELEFWAIRKD